ncbi:MAG: LysR substrate-binding domain-containing protein [Kiloniellales bacterium]|nr:LysR substrate-binding domain-containing protein [Kiloniellales bacterium]
MQSLRARLPPLNALVAFEASARHLSFTKAGQELGVSREAVSRQIRGLEDRLGVALFRRRHRALDLTPAGEELEAVVHGSLEAIAHAAGALQRRRRPSKLTVTATIAIATFWLTPRLPRFRAAHPGAEIRVVVSDAPVDMAAEGIDLGLRYGDGKWRGLKARHLFDVESFPVCAPEYLESGPPIAAPEDLVAHTLLNLDGTPHAVEDWRWWLAGAAPTDRLKILGFDSYANVIQAACEGQGVALGFSGIIDGLIARGALVRPIAESRGRGQAVYLAVPADAGLSPLARKFHDWVLAEAAAGEGSG